MDSQGISGVGILLTKEMIEKAIEKGLFTEEEWADEDNRDECVSRTGVPYVSAGIEDYKLRYYLLVRGDTLGEILNNSNSFLKQVRWLGVNISKEDLLIIDDEYIW